MNTPNTRDRLTNLAMSALVAITAAALLATSGPAHAAVPQTGQVEGVLSSAGGGPAADGTYAMTFALYTQAVGGAPVWTETGSIAAKSGMFSWLLGSKTPLTATTLNLPAAYLGLTVGTDPELPRQPLAAAPYAVRAAVAEGLDCSGCLKATALDAGVLQPFAKTTDLGAYAKSTDLGAYAKTTDLGDYVKVAALATVAGTGSYGDLKNTPALAKVATSGAYADLTNVPVAAKVGASCGTGLVLIGFKVDGALDCGPLAIPADYIDEISNNLIFNQFIDKVQGAADTPIPDGIGAGVTTTLDMVDFGTPQAVWVDVDLLNSDVSKLKIELFGPGMVTPYTVYDGGKTGTLLKVSFNKDTLLASGDLTKDWVGKSLKGTWSLTVRDPIKNQATINDGKFNWSLNTQTMSSKKIEIKGNLIVDGAGTSPGAALDIASTTQGFLPPRMTTVQRNAITGPVPGLTVYNTDTKCLDMHNGTTWGSLCPACTPGVTVANFAFTGGGQNWTVPTGVTCIKVTVKGAGGAGGTPGGWNYGAAGGEGGYTVGTIPVTPGETLLVMVGEKGYTNQGNGYGYGGGASATNNGSDNQYAGGGGGLSAVFRGAAPLLIAGGGGGGGSSRAGTGNTGGAGGGLAGGTGQSPYDGKTSYGGTGGTQTAGGTATGGQGGTQYQGGHSGTNSYGGGGGGGYWGGGGGGYSESNTMGGGGGGSGYLASTVSGGATGNGGGAPGGGPSVAGTHGAVVIAY